MSEMMQGPGWWQASDGKWYPPESHPNYLPPPTAQIPALADVNATIPPSSGPKNKKPLWRRWWVLSIGVLFAIGVVGAIADAPSGGPSNDAPSSLAATASESQTSSVVGTSTVVGEANAADPMDQVAEASGSESEGDRDVEAETPNQPALGSDLTKSQQNAVRSADSYLRFTSFSRQGLIDQLSSDYGDKFEVEDATIAVDSLNVDWGAEAVEAAEGYLELTSFSREGLIHQLSAESGDRFTADQATFAVNSLTTDWNAEAAEAAASYLEFSAFSCQGLIDQLTSDFGDRFTTEQATFGASETGIC